MTDITKCTNSRCGKRERCYRYSATAHESWQSYSHFKPNENGECEHFMDIKPRKKQIVYFDPKEI